MKLKEAHLANLASRIGSAYDNSYPEPTIKAKKNSKSQKRDFELSDTVGCLALLKIKDVTSGEDSHRGSRMQPASSGRSLVD